MKRLKPVFIIPIAVILIATITWQIFFRSKLVVVIINGEVQGVTSNALTVKGILRDAEIVLQPQDQVDPPLSKWVKNKDIIYITRSSQIILSFDDQTYRFYSSERSPLLIINQLGINIPQDAVAYVNGKAYSLQDEIEYSPFQQIEILTPINSLVSINNTQQEYYSSAKSLAELLWINDLPIYESTSFGETLSSPVASKELYELAQPNAITIDTIYRDYSVPVPSILPGDALAQAGVPLQFIDYINVDENAAIAADQTIIVTGVFEKIALDQQLINFDTQRQPLADLEIDNQKLVQSGEYGLEAQRIRIRYEDDQEVSRKKEDAWVAREPVPRIEGYGTKIVVRTTNTDDGPIEYWRSMTFYATSYSPAHSGVSPDKSWYGHVYCGGVLKNGYVAVDLTYIPCGTQLYIPGYGYAVAMDTGGISGAWIDLGYEDKDYVAWHQNVTVYFLTPVPAADSIAYTIPSASQQ